MKRTDQERIERELRRREKKVKVTERRTGGRPEASPSAYISSLLESFQFDDQVIYNTSDDEEVMELLIGMKEDLPEKDWDGVLRSAIRKTKVQQKDTAFSELKAFLSEC